MKKMLVLLLVGMNILPLLWGCTKNDDVACYMGTYWDKNWEETFYTYTGDPISDTGTAIAVATAIFNGMIKSDKGPDWVPQSVFYDEPDEIYIVSFCADSDMPTYNDWNIAIRKQDGKVMRIWSTE